MLVHAWWLCGFEWSSADLEAATDEVLRLKQAADECEKKVLEAYIALGHKLREVKSHLKHGEWLPWLERVGIAARTAQIYMAVAKDENRYKGNLADVRTTERKNGKSASLAYSGAGQASQAKDNGSNGSGDPSTISGKSDLEKLGEIIADFELTVKKIDVKQLHSGDRNAFACYLKSVHDLSAKVWKDMVGKELCRSSASSRAHTTCHS